MPVDEIYLSGAVRGLLERLNELHDEGDREWADCTAAWCRGYIAALMMIDAIDSAQYKQLSELTRNARQHAAIRRAAP